MKKTITIFFILFFAFSYAQSLHIKYDYKVSDISNMTEDLYLLKDKSLSVKDSIVSFNHQNTNPKNDNFRMLI